MNFNYQLYSIALPLFMNSDVKYWQTRSLQGSVNLVKSIRPFKKPSTSDEANRSGLFCCMWIFYYNLDRLPCLHPCTVAHRRLPIMIGTKIFEHFMIFGYLSHFKFAFHVPLHIAVHPEKIPSFVHQFFINWLQTY